MKKIIKKLTISLGLLTLLTACGSSEKEMTVISREEGSGTRSAFVELVGIVDKDKNDITTKEAVIQNNTEAVMTAIEKDENSIGYISLGSLGDKVKALKVEGVEANGENVSNGSYKISRPFNIVTDEKVEPATQDFINFILSTEGQKIVEDSGYIKSVEDAKEFKSDNSEGNIAIAGSSSVTPVMEKLVEGYKKVNPKVKIQVNLSDSTSGIQSVNDGIAQIGMVSRELKDSEKGLKDTVIALDGIAVIANKSNEANDLKLEDIKKIYSGEVTSWEEISK
ncbi:substrate-binding domain-containing protein [Miniphocaeibacter massiliensis]|uniref:substrate-binding domain-containing protein n=1 Tax=Miniphocaeibacter massiliensis TaxID=2041841 RepID=UPI000C1B87C0|nr:substrate-binding domain-containing protein [Miniphocaeibacter massiliensis]